MAKKADKRKFKKGPKGRVAGSARAGLLNRGNRIDDAVERQTTDSNNKK